MLNCRFSSNFLSRYIQTNIPTGKTKNDIGVIAWHHVSLVQAHRKDVVFDVSTGLHSIPA